MRILQTVLGAVLLAGFVPAQEAERAAPAQPAYVQKAAYPMSTCVVSGEPLEGEKVKTFEAGERTFKTCCGKCKAKVEKDPETYAAKLDAAIQEQQLASYPLEACPVSGKELGSMGDPHRLVLAGTLVQLCCKGCVKKAEARSDEIVAQIHDAAYEAQQAAYPMTTCVVSGEALGESPHDVMFGMTLVRFCCEKCVAKFEADQATHMAKLEKARTAGKPADAGTHEGHGDHGKHDAGKSGAAGSGGCCDDAGCGSESGGCCGSK